MSRPINPVSARFGPRRQVETGALPNFEWKAARMAGTAALFVPMVTVVKSATLLPTGPNGDVNGNGFVNPGDTLMYSVLINNTGTDALNVVFTDQLNSDLTLIGTANASPIVRDETYAAIGNTQLQVAASQTITTPVVFMMGNVLSNDIDPDGGTLSAVAGTGATALGGSVTMNTDGTFVYTPPVNTTAMTDTFTYTVTDGTKTTTGTISFTLTERVWYVRNNAGAGDGRSNTPFNTLAAAQTASSVNDYIFIHRGDGTTTGQNAGITLKNGQRLIGEDVALVVGGFTLVADGMAPVIGNAAGSGITLAMNNTVRGLTVDNTTAAAITGSSFGTLTLDTVTINTTNQALSLTTGTANATFSSVTSSGGTNNIALTSVAGTVSLGSGALSGATSNAVDVNQGTAGISYSGTITAGSALAVDITNKTAGTVALSGAVSGTGAGRGVNLTTNTGTTINFTGGVTLNTGTTAAFTATGGGTVAVTGSANTLTTTTGTALNVANTFIGTSGLTFLSINVNGATNGIILDTTGTTAGTHGGLTVTGTGTTDGTGGTIQNTTGRGASFISTRDVSLKNMNFTNAGTSDLDATNGGLSTGDNLDTNAAIHLQTVTNATLDNLNISGGAEQGINGNTVSAFTLTNSSISNVGNAADEDNIHFFNMSGTSAITNTTLTQTTGDDNLNLQTTSGTLTLTISGGSATGGGTQLGSGYLFGIRGTTNATITFSSANSSNNFSGGIVADAFDTATMDLTVSNSTSSSNNDQLSVSAGDSSNVDLDATGNTLSSPNAADFVVISLVGSAFDNGFTFDALINDNDITVGNGRTADGISVFNAGGGAMRIAITNNNIDYAGTQRAILVQAGQDGNGATNVTITGNNIDIELDGAGNAVAGILAQSAITGPGNTSSLCADIGGAGGLSNTFTHSLGGSIAGGDIRVRQRNDGTVRLPGFGGSATDLTAVINYLNGRNVEVSPSTATADSTGFAGGAACTQPVLALATPLDGSEQLKQQVSSATQHVGGNTNPSFFAQVRQWFNPVFAAFTTSLSYARLDRAFDRTAKTIVPTAAAAELEVPPLSGSDATTNTLPPKGEDTNKPARTMIVNSRGEYRIVPTAALPKLMAGELITINGTGSGFTLPAGESTTVMFNAQISSSFTGTAITNQATVSPGPGGNFSAVMSNNLSTPVIQPPSINKAFSPTHIALSGTNLTTSTLTLTVTNPNVSQQLTNIDFSDTFPTGLAVADTPMASASAGCGAPTFNPAADATTISFIGGTINVGTPCVVSVKVKGTTTGAKNNTVPAVISLQSNSGGPSNTTTLFVLPAPSLTKNFGAPSIAVGGTTSLTFNITNNDTSFGLTGVSFTDTLPAGLTVATAGATAACGGTYSTTAPNMITLTGGTLAASGTCNFSVTVTGTTAGTKNNSVALTTTETGTNTTPATSSLNVFGPPTIGKSFTPNSIVTGQTSMLNITVTNPASNPDTLTGLSFTDTLPAGITAPDSSTTSCNGGTLAVSGNVITLTGGSLASGANCVNSVTVTGVAASATAYTNTISSVTSANGGTNNTPATANITVNKANTSLGSVTDSPDPSVTGQPYTVGFTLSVTAPGSATPTAPTGTVTITDGTGGMCTATLPTTSCSITSTTAGAKTLTLTYSGDSNFNTSNTTAGHQVNQADTTTTITSDNPDPSSPGASVTVNFTVAPVSPGTGTPSGNVVVTVSGGAETCTGTVASGTCNITLTGTGMRTLTATYAGDTNFNGSSDTEDHTVINPLMLTKSFLPVQIKVGETSVMTFMITNNNAGNATGISFSDTFPGGLEVDTPVVTTNNCNGSFSPGLVGGETSFSYVGGSVNGNSSCTISVQVKATSAGLKDNTTGPISSMEGGVGSTSNTATLTVVGAPVLTKAFTPSTVVVGQTSSLDFTITNNNTTVALSDIQFNDTLPAGMTVGTSGPTAACNGGTYSTTAPNMISFMGGALAAGTPTPTTCTFSVTVTATQTGMHSNTSGVISAFESGPGATSNTAILTVNGANTTTTITADTPDPSVVGQPYAVTAVVMVTPPGMGVPTGTITVSDGTGGTCTITLPATACNLTSTTAGAKTLTATYNGDANFNGSTSAGVPHTVNKADTTTTITNAATLGSTPTVVGQAYAVNWSVTVNSPGALGAALSGNVTVDAGGGNTCTAAVSAGTCNIISTTAGVKSITATYAGDANYNGSASAGASHTVNKADTTTTITNAATLASTPTIVGEAYAVNWSVTVNAPGALGAALTGNVTVSDGTGGTCTAAVSAGTCNITSTTTGVKTITATYAGDANYQGSTSAGATHTVNKPGTTTTITADTPDPTVTGQAYQVDVSVTVNPPGMGTPTGTVNISDGTGGSCVATLGGGGTGSCMLTSTTAGAKTLTATYNGDANFNGSTSAGVPHTVNKADTTLTSLTDSPDPSVTGQPYTVGFTLNVTAPGAGTPTGTVTVNDGAGGMCTATLPATSCSLTSTTAGVKTLTFTYSGDANFNGSTNTAGHLVNKADTTTTITADTPDPSVFGQNYAVTASVAANAPGGGTPTSGTITVTDGTNNCTITLPATSCNLPSTSVGAKTLTATYSGDANYNGSGPSAGVPHTVNKADTTTTITSDNPDSSAVGQNVTVAFTVAAQPPGAGTPTGTVTITASGGAETCTGTLAAGAGSCTLALTVAGARTLTATYNGDTNFNTSTDDEPHTVVAPPSIAKAFNPMAVPVNGVSTLTLAITNPAVNTVALTGVGVVDNFLPGAPGLVVHTTPAATNSCATGTFTPVAGANSISISGATIPVGTTCNFTVQVRGTMSGPQVNTTDPVTSTNGGTGNSATATLQVNVPPVITPINMSRAAGSTPPLTTTIANVTDVEDPEDQLVVQISTDGTNFFDTVTTGNVTVTLVDQVAGGSVNPTAAGAVIATITTPCNAVVGPLNLFLRATDTGGQMDTKPWTLTITSNPPPTLSYANQTVTAGSTGIINPATGPSDNGTINPLVLQSIVPAVGLTLSLNTATGQLMVISATLIGNYAVTVSATDNCNMTTNATFNVNVICPTITLTPTSLPNGVQGTAYNQTVSAAPAGTTYSYAVTVNTLPPGLSLNSATGAITGTPTASGNYTFGITATGWGGCTKTQSYNLLITGTCATITVNPTTLPGTTIGTAYSQTITATGGIAPYTFAVTQGALPAGLTLNTSSGALTGTPTAGGSFSFRITATGQGGCMGSRTYVLSVTCPTLTFNPASLPSGTRNATYNQTLSITQAGTYTFSLLVGSLPPGFTLSSAGVLSGVTSQTGTFNFTVKAVSGSCQGTKSYSLVINANGAAMAQMADYNGDGKSDFALWSPTGTWRLALSGAGAQRQTQTQSWGTKGDLTLLGDYDGDGQTDLAVFRPASGTWYILKSGHSGDGGELVKVWGTADDVPVPGDYDGDGRTDIAVFRPSDGNWYVLRSSDGQYAVTAWGAGYAPYHDVAVPGDYDGDGKTDLAVFRRSTGTWLVKRSSDGQFTAKAWGLGTDIPVAADYDGDGQTDFAVWRQGAWYIWQSARGSLRVEEWGASAAPYFDRTAPGDYDGDGQADITVWRAGDQTWYVRCSVDGSVMSQAHGQAGDRPVTVLPQP